MAVTIKDLLNLEIMQNFKIVAGEKGLNRAVTATEILDFEFMQEPTVLKATVWCFPVCFLPKMIRRWCL